MNITFIMPSVGKKRSEPYVKSWLMEPLSIAVLNTLTPGSIDRVFYDDRLEEIPYDEPTDLAAITVETYTARRAYQIAEQYRMRGVPVVMGGFHATLMPDEVEEQCGCVVIGAAEGVWEKVCRDAQIGKLKNRYQSESNSFSRVQPDRSIYSQKKYVNLSLIETGRGCRFSCEFCSISSFFNKSYFARPIEDVIAEIKILNSKRVFFIDDNIAVDIPRTKELLQALIPLKITWVGQVSINAADDPELLTLMKRSGCAGVLIGFESLNEDNLRLMRKGLNKGVEKYQDALKTFRECGLGIYGTFIFGYDSDTKESFEKTLHFVIKNKLFFAAFNHLVPFPGTPLYTRMKNENTLRFSRWWLEKNYRFGDIAFNAQKLSTKELTELSLQYRKKFYSIKSILYRAMDFKANCASLFMTIIYFTQNLLSQRDVLRRQGLPLGDYRYDQSEDT